MSLLLRTIQMNPSVTFLLMGDERPPVFDWPSNAKFERISLQKVLLRAQSVLGVKLPPQLSVAGGASKISDFKPMFGELFPENLLFDIIVRFYVFVSHLTWVIEERSTLTFLSMHHTLLHGIGQEIWWLELHLTFLIFIVLNRPRTLWYVFD